MSKLTTPLCQKPGIEHPVIGAPISAEPEFVAAVSNSGGLGIIQASWHEAEELLDTISQVRRLTDRPFGANFVLPLIEDQGFANLIAALEAKVPVISTFWGDPAPVVERIRDADALSLPTVGSAEEARRVVDVVMAQGVEAGGHVWGQVGTIALTPAVVDAIPDAHTIAAGGIADGRGLAAVLALGPGAAWIGTRLLLATECQNHRVYRDKLKSAVETDTVRTKIFDGTSARSKSAEIGRQFSLGVARANAVIDRSPDSVRIRAALERLEKIALQKGVAIAVGTGLPETITEVSQWANTLADKNIVLIPVSAVYAR